MFTGIVETVGRIEKIESQGTNKHFLLSSAISNELKADQSVSHNGVCLTVTKQEGSTHWVTAVQETLQKSNLGELQPGSLVNLERCMQLNGRLDGHIVQGHVDTIAVCTSVIEKDGSWEYSFETDRKFAGLIIEKGSISLNGISLTIFNVTDEGFSVAIILFG